MLVLPLTYCRGGVRHFWKNIKMVGDSNKMAKGGGQFLEIL